MKSNQNIELNLSRNLKRLLQERGITAAQLSRETGIPQQTLNNWLGGCLPRRINQLAIVGKYFDITLEKLLFK